MRGGQDRQRALRTFWPKEKTAATKSLYEIELLCSESWFFGGDKRLQEGHWEKLVLQSSGTIGSWSGMIGFLIGRR